MHQIPGSLPSTCTVSAPIWSTDEFGELYAIKPTSALDVNIKASSSSSRQQQQLPIAKPPKNAGGSNNKAAGTKKTASKFNIYDDVNDQVECKLDSQSNAALASVDEESTKQQPVNKLAEEMAACCVHDDVRDMPPGSSLPLSPPASGPATGQITPSNWSNQRATASSENPATSQSPPAVNDDLQELAMMHSRLEECLINYERIQNGGAKVECPLKGGECLRANKWVTRYVDYTSKYGLGFLLNDGSSGVYFNDSTKAVHSASGDNFVYVERRKTSAGGVTREPVSLYTLTNYPEDTLKKKVTLLQHFRSYLLEQQKRAEEAGEAEPLFSEERQDSSCSDNDDNTGSLTPMVFMKKWIKTKHAMLFRLSNGTVQVLFYDMTEVLISSEGNLITFVDKEKNRFVSSIAEVANKQHGDVSRRLKYAKEILSQLISASKR